MDGIFQEGHLKHLVGEDNENRLKSYYIAEENMIRIQK